MKRGKFSLSNYKLFTCDMGELIPCGLMEVLPGDTIQQSTSALIRCSPLLAPIMHPVHVRIHHWYVPHRIVWEDWEDFITGGEDGMDASVLPTITSVGGAAVGTLFDYMGVPTGITNVEVSALPFRAYQLIYNEFYRDQDLQAEAPISKASGADSTTSGTLQHVCWEKDYFTTARPWEQKGPAITVPIGDSAPVTLKPRPPNWGEQSVWTPGGGTPANAALYTHTGKLRDSTGSSSYILDPSGNYIADLSATTGVSINLLREAFALQRFQEARARFGSRYTEYLRYLGVRSSDARLQRPEYLGGGRQTIQFSEVLSTADNGSETNPVPVGALKGHGIGAMRSNRYRRFFEEHGYVISLMSVKPKTMYYQGVPRHFNRRAKEDFWQRELQHIGQQEILKKEVYWTDDGTGNEVFGYQDRYDEYRRTPSTVAGQMRSVFDFWHMARTFSSAPALNNDFVRCVPTERGFVDNTSDTLLIMANHSVQARRLLSQTGSSFIF